jgi:hypothetical protein
METKDSSEELVHSVMFQKNVILIFTAVRTEFQQVFIFIMQQG